MILLDTDVLIEILDKESDKGDRILATLEAAEGDLGTSSVNLHELLYGLKKYSKSEEKMTQLRVVPYERRDAELSSRLELVVDEGGRPVTRLDSMIAAVAINRSAKLPTLDVGRFQPLAQNGLKIFLPGV